jgi:UPF0755 protein
MTIDRDFILRRILILITLAFLLSSVALVADFREFLRQPLSLSDDTLVYEILPGTSLSHVANDLRELGLLKRPLYWRLMAKVKDQEGSLKAGEYRLQNPLTPGQLLDQFVAGRTIQYSLTLLEGWSFDRVIQELAIHPRIKQTLTSKDDLMAILGDPGMPPEGWFYPDTFYFPNATTDVEFLRRSYDVMKKRLQQEWASRTPGLPLKSPYEALILASIVEKETALPEERPLIAAVFLSRLDRNMKLQTDPTVIYGLGNDFDGNITHKDLRNNTPYNTYLHKGLPPTPIALPSGGSLHAVLNPVQTKALYFVAKGDGSHHFSETYDEHRKAVNKYQLKGDASHL